MQNNPLQLHKYSSADYNIDSTMAKYDSSPRQNSSFRYNNYSEIN